jgi:phosphoribosylanthranilate isomerase
MRRVRIKVCGLTRVEDAVLAADLGADAIGFVLWPGSPRATGVDEALAIGRAVPPFVTRVGVVVDPAVGEINEIVRTARLDVLQLHGHETPGDFADVPVRLIKAVALDSDAAVEAALQMPDPVLLLVDASDPARRGGTGRRADWERAARLSARRRIVLAGGLTPENVAEAMAAVSPWGVDVSSGVELSPGRKDAGRVRAFFAAVTTAQGAGQ